MGEGNMRVVEVETQDQKIRYVVVDAEGKLVIPAVHYLKYLDRLGSARNTLRSYAAALRLYWEFLSQEQFDWQRITLDDLSRFVLWLKLPFGSARNTLRSYAAALRLYWEFLSQEQFDWQRITLDDLSRFVLWLKLPFG